MLKLQRVLEPAKRRSQKGFGRSGRVPDAHAHGAALDAVAEAVSVEQLSRSRVLSVDPRLVLVIEFVSAVEMEDVRRSGMTVLDGSDRHAVVAFADDPDLQMFHERLAAYMGPIPEGQKHPQFMAFFESIERIRRFGASDRVSRSLAEHLEALDEEETLRLDVQCWHPDSRDLADQWVDDLRTAVSAAGGSIPSIYRNDSAGVILARVYLPSDMLWQLAEIDVVASVDLLPKPDFATPDLYGADVDSFPPAVSASTDSPIVGIVDSGVASAHPLLAGSVLLAETLSPHFEDGEDRHGHGTMVASLAVHGSIAEAIQRPQLTPLGRIVSVRVLDADGYFPEQSLWEEDLVEAVEYCIAQGARVINLSVGDATKPFMPPRQHAASALVDELARVHDVIIIASAGNSDPRMYVRPSEDPTRSYVADLLEDPETGVLAPGTAAIALTIGGISKHQSSGAHVTNEPAQRRPFGKPGWPSTVTRRGGGVGGSLKPELVASSGTHSNEPLRLVVSDAESSVVGAGAGQTGRLLRHDIGTSFAAPLVTHVALGVLSRFPDFSANLVRALLLLGAEESWNGDELVVEKPSERAQAVRSLIGYGETSLSRALDVSNHRGVLIAESEIGMDAVHVYEIPTPSSFFQSGGSRSIEIALAFDPPTRVQRLDYLGNKMEFHLVRGMDLEEITEVFAKLAPEADREMEGDAEDLVGEGDENDEEDRPPTISELGRNYVGLDTSATLRSRSANQLGRRRFSRKFSLPDDAPLHLVVRSVNRWCGSDLTQPYGLAVSLRRDIDQPEIYSELWADLEAVVEVDTEVEVETEIEI